MTRLASRLVVGWLVALARTAWPADAPLRAEPPAGFAVRATGTLEAVVYAEVVAQSPNPIDRATIEAQCEAARKVGLTTRHPLFEPGHDQPVRTETVRFGNARHRVDFVTRQSYDCEPPSRTTRAADVLCGCTYRRRIHRSVHTETDDGTSDPAHELERVRRLAPLVLGTGTVAGIACVWRRQPLSADARIDRCVIEDAAGALPPWLRGRVLAETMFREGADAAHTWSRAARVIIDAQVDAGVFAVRPGDAAVERAR